MFTSSANAVVAKRGSEAYDVSKAALSHLIRELAVSMAPQRARERDQSGDGGEGIDDVSARPRARFADESTIFLSRNRSAMRSCAAAWPRFTPSAR